MITPLVQQHLPTRNVLAEAEKIINSGNSLRAFYHDNEGGDYFVECENMEPGSFGDTKMVPLGELSIMSW